MVPSRRQRHAKSALFAWPAATGEDYRMAVELVRMDARRRLAALDRWGRKMMKVRPASRHTAPVVAPGWVPVAARQPAASDI
jgi:hypothetical protein